MRPVIQRPRNPDSTGSTQGQVAIRSNSGERIPRPAASIRTSPRTRRGYAIATSPAIAPPMECPTSTASARPSESMKATVRLAYSALL